eukprot:UN01964
MHGHHLFMGRFIRLLIVLGCYIQVKQIVRFTYHFTQPDIIAVDIYAVMADLAIDEYLECYEYDNEENERIEDSILARLYINYGLQKTEMVINTTAFYTNAYCQIDLPITHAYPSKTFGVLHEVYVKDHKDSYFTTWSYPQYKNDAEIQT